MHHRDPQRIIEALEAQTRHSTQLATEAPVIDPAYLIGLFTTTLDDAWAHLADLDAEQLFYQARATATYCNATMGKAWDTEIVLTRWQTVLAKRRALLN